MNETLLIELQVEELPPRSLKKLGECLAMQVHQALAQGGFADASSIATSYASPRRLAASVTNVAYKQPTQTRLRKGPSQYSALVDGKPTAALIGFAKACGVSIDALIIDREGKEAVYACQQIIAGKDLSEVLTELLDPILKSLSGDTFMRWSDQSERFIRPVHGLVVIFGKTLIPCQVLGVSSTTTTRGHRFLSPQRVQIDEAGNYAKVLKKVGKVIASFEERRAFILSALNKMADDCHATIANLDPLLNEVTALVEWPSVLLAHFDPQFLRLPKECLIVSMQEHQKYFPLLDAKGALMNQFLLVANIAPDDTSAIIRGNERVIQARLDDAAFFFDQDQQTPLAAKTAQLAHIVYHHQLGSQLDRVKRLEVIARNFAPLWQIDLSEATRAAYLTKADLLTDMVGEFPYLQGVMGRYYALHDGESEVVAKAIEEHYCPRFSEDDLPSEPLGELLALADKLEILIGIMGLGILPTGDKDPFALRRAALGVLRILLNRPIDFKVLCRIVLAAFPEGLLSQDTLETVYRFSVERLKYYLMREHAQDIIEAVLAHQPSQFNAITKKIEALAIFRKLPEAATLLSAHKRVKNMLHQSQLVLRKIAPEQFTERAEKKLFHHIQTIRPELDRALDEENYQVALQAMTSLKTPIDQFFDEVLVMVDDSDLKNNRLALLALLSSLFDQVADLSLLTE